MCVSVDNYISETCETITIPVSNLTYGNCLSHGNASRVNYVDLDLH